MFANGDALAGNGPLSPYSFDRSVGAFANGLVISFDGFSSGQ